MNFGEIKTRVSRNVGRNFIEFNEDVAQIVKTAIRSDICGSRNYWFMLKDYEEFNTSNGVSAYTLPTDFKDELIFWYHESGTNSYIELPTLSEREYRDRWSSDDEGEPEGYLLTPTSLIIAPKPDDVYAITGKYYSYLDEFVDDTDENYLTINHPELVIAIATARAFDRLQEPQDGMAWWSKVVDPRNGLMIQLNRQATLRELGGEVALSPRSSVKGPDKSERFQE